MQVAMGNRSPAGRSGRRVAGWLDVAARWLLAAVFLFAAGPKIMAPRPFAEIIGAYGLLPSPLLLPAAIILPLAEIAGAVLLLFGKRLGLWLSAAMMVCFIGVLGYGIHLGLDIDCGCFGPDDPEHAAFSGLRTALVRDLLLLVPLVYGFWHSFHNISEQQGEKR